MEEEEGEEGKEGGDQESFIFNCSIASQVRILISKHSQNHISKKISFRKSRMMQYPLLLLKDKRWWI